MNVHRIHDDERTIRVKKRLARQGAQGLMTCGMLISAKCGPVDIYITVDGGQLRMEASPKLIADKDLSKFLWRCHNGGMTISVNSAGRLLGTIHGNDHAILKALAEFDPDTKAMIDTGPQEA